MAWFGHALGHDSTTRDLVCRLLFSKDEGLGFNIVRYNIGGANQEHADEYRPGGAVPCFAQPDPAAGYDWGADAGQVSMLLAAVQLGADNLEAFVNSPPWFWTVSGSSRGHQHPLRSNLSKQHIQDYAKFCADVVTHFQEQHGITFQSLSPFNEPSSPAWCLAANCKQEACFFSRSRAQKVLRALLQQPGLQHTKIAAFEQFCVRDTLGDLTHLPADLRPAVSRVNTHTYNSGVFFSKLRAAPLKPFQDNRLARKRLRRLLHKWGDVPLRVSEFGTGQGALQLARHIVKDLSTLLPSAWVYWQAVEDLGAGWGLLEMPMQHPNTSAAASGGGAASVAGAAGSAAAEKVLVAAGGQVVDSTEAGAGASSSGNVDGGIRGQGARQQKQQATAAKAVLHPNYFVLLFLVQAVPVGSRLCAVKGLGRRGVGVWRPPASNGAGAAGQWSVLSINPSARKVHTFRVAPSSFPAAGVGGPTASKVTVTLLDVAGQQPVTVAAGAALPGRAQLAAGWHTLQLALPLDGGSAVVEVPPGHLCLARVC